MPSKTNKFKKRSFSNSNIERLGSVALGLSNSELNKLKSWR